MPDLYAHIGPDAAPPAARGSSNEPSALTGRARVFVTAWVLVIVPILLSMSLSAILLFPKLAASAWESGSHIVSAIPDQAGDGDVLGLLASIVRLFALALPVVGVGAAWSSASSARRRRKACALERRAAAAPGRSCSPARPAGSSACSPGPGGRRASTSPCAPTDNGTLVGAVQDRRRARGRRPARAASAAPPRLSPGPPPGRRADPARRARRRSTRRSSSSTGRRRRQADDPRQPRRARRPQGADARRRRRRRQPAEPPSTPPTARHPPPTAPSARRPRPRRRPQLPFKLPDKPGEDDSQALATNTTDGGIIYDVAYSLVTVSGGEPVDNENSAYALASCNACTTVAVSFQLVLVVGQSDRIMPINVAEALNLNCPCCITTAIAKQIVVSVTSAPSEELLRRLTAELKKLDAIDTNDSPADVLAQVNAVTDAIQRELDESGITYPKATPTPAPAKTPDAERRTPDASAKPGIRGQSHADTHADGDRGADGDPDAGADADADGRRRRRRRPPRRPRRRDTPGNCASARLPSAARPLWMSARPSFTVEYLEPRRGRGGAASRRVLGIAAAALAGPLGRGRAWGRRRAGARARARLAAGEVHGRPAGMARAGGVLQLGSCAAYVLVFRGVFCRRMSWRTSTEIGLSELAANSVLLDRRRGRARARRVDPASRRPARRVHRPAHGGVLPADEPRERHLPRARRAWRWPRAC